jgi:hypothetical protein
MLQYRAAQRSHPAFDAFRAAVMEAAKSIKSLKESQ